MWTRSGSRRGVSDIIACLAPDGKFLAIEIKFGKDALRPDQIEFRQEIKNAGGEALVVSKLIDFERWYDAWVRPSVIRIGPGPIYTEYTPPKN